MSSIISQPRQCHSILHDYHRNKSATDQSSMVELDGNKYRVTVTGKDEYSVQKTFSANRVADFFNSSFGRSGKTTKLISSTLNGDANHRWYNAGKDHVFEGICFPGGGAKGIAHNGVVQQLGDAKLKQVTQVSGASAGALTALIVALGLSTKEIDARFKAQSPEFTQQAVEANVKESILIALNREPYLRHLGDILGRGYTDTKLENITFSQLEALRERIGQDETRPTSLKQLFISASLYEKELGMTGEVKCSADNTPNMPILKAAMASSALPIFFDPVEVDTAMIGLDLGEKKQVKLRDGGVHNNLPRAYLTTTNNLVISFGGNEGIHQKSISFFEKIKQFFCGEPAYQYRRADHAIADRHGVYYSHIALGPTEVEKAVKNVDHYTALSAKNFDYHLKYVHRKENTLQSTNKQNSLDENWELNNKKYGGKRAQAYERQHVQKFAQKIGQVNNNADADRFTITTLHGVPWI